ncbi:ABC transporter ATP-binding protein [Rhodococcus sp. ARC_M6]|uniref:ABC transporter ATP-binding protein n=1 Tax=Rhodococcus sp. ARC_M6 TaxID=2928852 RepID=UPI001FB2C9C1|nr:ABC transporter ATP-binding protein [Rhodococcus sp. ARC_M6]MCJ0907222.1 ABC transporter ATP-binding protein [Rhodococcus sp. ARC_M6]
MSSAANTLTVEGLTLDLAGVYSQKHLVDDVSFTIPRGRSVGLIGESGCGKTMTAMAIVGLLPPGVSYAGGSIRLGDTDLMNGPPSQLARVRGRSIGTIFQDPMNSLNPTASVGDQIAESRRIHLGESRSTARQHAIALLDKVGIPDSRRRVNSYPHELSGGMQQRVMIAAAISCSPDLIIADEPTTALDVTVQEEILQLLRDLQEETSMSVLLVTHDLGVVSEFCDDVVIMYAGHVVEKAKVNDFFFDAQQHPYSRALLRAVPDGQRPRQLLEVIPGRVPPAGSFPPGCRFQPRCEFTVDACSVAVPAESLVQHDHTSRCSRVAAGEIDLREVL